MVVSPSLCLLGRTDLRRKGQVDMQSVLLENVRLVIVLLNCTVKIRVAIKFACKQQIFILYETITLFMLWLAGCCSLLTRLAVLQLIWTQQLVVVVYFLSHCARRGTPPGGAAFSFSVVFPHPPCFSLKLYYHRLLRAPPAVRAARLIGRANLNLEWETFFSTNVAAVAASLTVWMDP